MTEISRPWTGRTSQGALGDAGAYSAAQWQQLYAHMIGEGAEQANRGVIRGVLEELEVVANSPADTTVIIEPGSALVQGIFFLNNADKSVAIASNASGSTRIDIIVLEADYTAQTVRIDVVQGTPGAGVPALTQSAGSIWQNPLAYLTLASGYTSIPQSLITDWRNYANIPSTIGVNVTNSSGVTLEMGDVVIWLPAGGVAIDDSTTEGDRRVAGIIESRVLNGGAARIITNGIFPVLCDEVVAVGALLEISTTARQAQASLRGGVFARVLVANTGVGTRCLAYINVQAIPQLLVTGTYTGNGATTQAITGLGFKPRKVVVWRQIAGQPGGVWSKTDRDASTDSITFIDRFVGLGATYGLYSNDAIRSLDADGFTVGDNTDNTANVLNINLATYTLEAYR